MTTVSSIQTRQTALKGYKETGIQTTKRSWTLCSNLSLRASSMRIQHVLKLYPSKNSRYIAFI